MKEAQRWRKREKDRGWNMMREEAREKERKREEKRGRKKKGRKSDYGRER